MMKVSIMIGSFWSKTNAIG